jgi:3',5'-cyclic-AMP phosphodiesterase
MNRSMSNLPSPSRRAFLSTVSATALTVCVSHYSIGRTASAGTRIALLSDTHIHGDPHHEYRGFYPYENLKKAVEQVVGGEFTCSLLCGDAARLDGTKEDYLRLQELVKPLSDKMPLHMALGNHDDRNNFWSVFGAGDTARPLAGKKHVTVIDFEEQRWIVLDSLMYVDKTPGFLGEEQRNWLSQYLENHGDLPTILMVHHTLGPRDGELLDAERLIAIAQKHSHVKGIVFGHSHHWHIEKTGQLWFINLPALGYNFADTEPVGWVTAELSRNSLQLKLNPIAGNLQGELQSKTIDW